MLEILDRHPWGIDVPITGILGTNAQLSWLDRGLEALAETSLDEGAKAELVLLLNGYVFWAARLRFQVPSDAVVEVVPAGFDLSAFPSLARALAAGIFEDDSTHARRGLHVRPRARPRRHRGPDSAVEIAAGA